VLQEIAINVCWVKISVSKLLGIVRNLRCRIPVIVSYDREPVTVLGLMGITRKKPSRKHETKMS
jgi:hypothetical protein